MTALYRHFNAAGSLLYVGIADDHHVRFKAHLRFADWKDQIATVKIERFTTREEAHAAEVVAIRSEEPLYNKAHQKRGSRGDVLRQVFRAIDCQELEDALDDYNKTPCSKYRDYCFDLMQELCGELKIDFEERIGPQLVERDLPQCNDDCLDCREARSHDE